MKWQCKLCGKEAQTKGDLLKHYRLDHDCLGRHRSQPCLFSDCPCSFKTLSALRSHCTRDHHTENRASNDDLVFSCPNCASSRFTNEKEFFTHLRRHLSYRETVQCVFIDCDFQTNVYGTFAAHKSRKHTTHSVSDYKPAVLKRTLYPGNAADYEEHTEINEHHFNLVLDEEDESVQNTAVKKVGSLLLKLESLYHVSANCINQLVEEFHFISSEASAQAFRNIISNTLEKHNCPVDPPVITELVQQLCDTGPLSTALGEDGPFCSVYRRKKYFKENFDVVEPVEYIIDGREKRSFQYVPILKSLSTLLNNKNILEKAVESFDITNNVCTSDIQYTSFYDGTYFKENNFFSGDEFKIALILYVDDFEICNPLGTSKKTHKITAFYWVLGNIPAHLRSELTCIYLAVLCKADDVKKHGYALVLEPLLKDLVILEKEGVFVSSLAKNVKGTVQCVVADNLGAHSIGGFVESFSGQYPCRFCLGQRSDYQSKEVCFGEFQARTKEDHLLHVHTAVQSGTHSFGVKKQCPLTDKLSHFHVLKGYPPDILHDLFEGIVPMEIALCLSVFMKKKLLTLSEINDSIKHFPFKWSDRTNCPKAVPVNFASRKTIGGNAHENWALLRFLPFLIGLKIPTDEPAWLILMDLKEIVELAAAPIHTHETICYLGIKISQHKHRFLDVFPTEKLIPKHHFLEHYPDLIKAFGPLVTMWTMRFEGKHRFFKGVVRHTNSFKNILLSLATKHQLLMAFQSQNSSKPALSVSNVSHVPLDLLNADVQEAIRSKFPSQASVHLAKTVFCHGTKYCAGMILAHGSTAGLTDFVLIHQVVIVKNIVGFLVKTRKAWYDEQMRSFELEAPGHLEFLVQSELNDVVPLAAYNVGGKCMVTLKRHINVTF